MSQLDKIRDFLITYDARLAILSNPFTINYLTGFDCDPHERHLFLFVYHDLEPVLFVPNLELARARATVNFSVIGYDDAENPWLRMKADLPRMEDAIIFTEFEHLNLAKSHGLQTVFKGHFADISPYINQIRMIKTPEEIQKLTLSGVYADYATKVGIEAIRQGMTETDIIAHIEFELKKKGISQMSFDTLVLSGTNAANPHGIPGPNLVQNNDFLLFDLGVMYQGYASDMTRTVAVGQVDDFKKDIYQLVLEAQLTAQEVAKPGVTAGEVDAAARQVIEKAGYGDYFNHRLGHGIGIECHEFPSIMAGSDLVLQEGMAFSIEPGIYIPGKVGVRIEDCGYLDKDGFKPFTFTTKDLQTISL